VKSPRKQSKPTKTHGDALETFRKIYQDFGEFAKNRGKISESDTRANILDRVLYEVLKWPRESVRRETFSNPGYIDYEFNIGRPVLVLEAKAAGVAFSFPYQKTESVRHLKICGLLSASREAQREVVCGRCPPNQSKPMLYLLPSGAERTLLERPFWGCAGRLIRTSSPHGPLFLPARSCNAPINPRIRSARQSISRHLSAFSSVSPSFMV
jgi:hypothetical protein